MLTNVRDWIACIALMRAFGRGGRREAGDLWRRMTGFERKMLVAHLRSHFVNYSERLDRLRGFKRALAEDTEELEAIAQEERQRIVVGPERIAESGGRIVKLAEELTDDEIAAVRSAQVPPEHDYEYKDDPELDDDNTIVRGKGDFLRDMGIADPEEFRVKAHLCNMIALIIEDRDLTHEQAAAITGLGPADISRIVNSNFGDYPVWRLMKTLTAFGGSILIVANPESDGVPGIIMSQTAGE